jgi:hypothetical protein
MGHAGLGVAIQDGKIELVLGGVEVDEQAVDFVEDGGRTRVAAVDFVEHDDGRKAGGQSLLEDVTRLRERAFARVHEEEHAVHHAQGAFHFAAEVAVAGRVHDIDFCFPEKESGIFRQDGDAALALEVVRVHYPVHDSLVGAEDAGLAKHGVHERGLAVVHVSDDRDVSNGRHRWLVVSGEPWEMQREPSKSHTTS